VGLKKPEWHFRTGVNREMFAQLLVRIYQSVLPSMTILDGILAMQGQGPGKGGEPRKLGVVMGSKNAAAIDMTVCRMLGLPPEEVLTNHCAEKQGLVRGAISINGTLPHIENFKFPEITPLIFGPKQFHGLMRRHLVQRPECDRSLCKLCGECWKYCPAQAIINSKKEIHFDYDRCIRCYCCIEVCPHGALTAQETTTGRLVRKVLKL
jgi:ferredoxin